MNKTVFIMDGIGNAVHWAAGMRLDAMSGRGEVWINANASTYTIHTADPRKCVLKFVQALCLCPDGSLLIWDEDEQNVVCRGWVDNDVDPVPAIVDDEQEGWRVIGDDEVIQQGDKCQFCSHAFHSAATVQHYSWLVGYTVAKATETGGLKRAWRRTDPEQASSPKAPKPDRLPDGRPIIRVEGHPKWRELYDDEVIEEGDSPNGYGVFRAKEGVGPSWPWVGGTVIAWKEDRPYPCPKGKVYRRIKPKKQKAEEAQQ